MYTKYVYIQQYEYIVGWKSHQTPYKIKRKTENRKEKTKKNNWKLCLIGNFSSSFLVILVSDYTAASGFYQKLRISFCKIYKMKLWHRGLRVIWIRVYKLVAHFFVWFRIGSPSMCAALYLVFACYWLICDLRQWR